MDDVRGRQVLAALRRVADPMERAGIVWDAVQRVETDEEEQSLLEAMTVTIGRMGEGSARELLARLSWWLFEDEYARTHREA